ncbi:hypothetical protein BC629DRAFT_631264 [Irpex lacteus]|nr:hypothetical protein BC629DRAFT_631264 [Irpex lacteus]
MRNGVTVKPGQSDFITCLMRPGESQTFSQEQPVIDPESLALFSTVLGRPAPDETEVARRVAELRRLGKALDWPPLSSFTSTQDQPSSGDGFARARPHKSNTPGNQLLLAELPATVSFMSAKSIVVNEPTTPAPMSPSRRVPNRISSASETKTIPSAKSASTSIDSRKGNQNQNKAGLGGRKTATSRPPESESLASWLRPKSKPQSLVIEKRVEATVMKKPASTASVSSAIPRRQPSIKHQTQMPPPNRLRAVKGV